jgi:hypothetical protein
MTGLIAHLRLYFDYSARQALAGLSPLKKSDVGSAKLDFNFGGTNGLAKAVVLYDAVRTLDPGASEELVLSALTPGPINETTIAVTKAKGIVAFLLPNADASPSSASILLGNAATNAAALFLASTTHEHRVYQNGFYGAGVANAAGVPVTAGSADRLKVLNEDGVNKATYRLMILGE